MVFNPRKVGASLISLFVIGLLIYLLFDYEIQSPYYFITIFIFILIFTSLIATDFQFLQIGFGKLYFWIQEPEIKQKEIETLEKITQKLKLEYFSKKYYEDYENKQNKALKVVKVNENIAYVDSRHAWSDLKNGLIFSLKKEETIQLSDGKKIKACNPESLGIGKVREVKDITILDVEWNDTKDNKDFLMKVKSGDLEGLNIFAFIEIDKELEDSDSVMLKNVHDSMKNVLISKYKV